MRTIYVNFISKINNDIFKQLKVHKIKFIIIKTFN